MDLNKKNIAVLLCSYQNGPDTYLLQLRDVDFPCRLREYMKVATNRGPGRGLILSDDSGFDWRVRKNIKLIFFIMTEYRFY